MQQELIGIGQTGAGARQARCRLPSLTDFNRLEESRAAHVDFSERRGYLLNTSIGNARGAKSGS